MSSQDVWRDDTTPRHYLLIEMVVLDDHFYLLSHSTRWTAPSLGPVVGAVGMPVRAAAAVALAFRAFLFWLCVNFGFAILILEKMGIQTLINLQ